MIDMAVKLFAVDGVFRRRVRRDWTSVLGGIINANGREVEFPSDMDFRRINVCQESRHLGKLRRSREWHGIRDDLGVFVLSHPYSEKGYWIFPRDGDEIISWVRGREYEQINPVGGRQAPTR